jgi:hypothetical protein
MNTAVVDLKNQLKFLGIEDVEAMFQKFCPKKGHGTDNHPEQLVFFLSTIMIRHSQNQKYRGTSTTLMSLPGKVRVRNGPTDFS